MDSVTACHRHTHYHIRGLTHLPFVFFVVGALEFTHFSDTTHCQLRSSRSALHPESFSSRN